MSETTASETTDLTLKDFYQKLSERVSDYNAKLLLQSVVFTSGLSNEDSSPLNKEDAQAICLELIKKGGPAFQVGKDMYHRVQ